MEDLSMKTRPFSHLLFLIQRLCKKNFSFFLILTSVLSLVFSFGFVGVLTCHQDTIFLLQDAVEDNDRLFFTSRIGMSAEELKNHFPEDVFFQLGSDNLVYLETLPDDGRVYANEEVAKEFHMSDVYCAEGMEERELVIDNSLSLSFFATGTKSTGDQAELLTYIGNVWGTEKHYASYFSKYQTKFFATSSFYEKREGKPLPFPLEDNVFYVGDEELVPEDGVPLYEKPFPFSVNDPIDMDYPSLLDDLKIRHIPCRVGFDTIIIFVSDSTFETLAEHSFGNRAALIQLKNRRNEILSFLSSHNFTIQKTTASGSRSSLNEYNRVCEHIANSRNNANYQGFTYLMPLLGLLLLALATEFLLETNKENIINLRLQGEKRRDIMLLFSLPLFLTVVFSLSMGISFAYWILKVSYTALAFGSVYFLLICLVSFLIPSLLFHRRWTK